MVKKIAVYSTFFTENRKCVFNHNNNTTFDTKRGNLINENYDNFLYTY